MTIRILYACIALLAAAHSAFPQTLSVKPSRDISLLPSEVKDSFFAYVIGVIRSDLEVELNNAEMREILTEFKTAMNLPFDLIDKVRQWNDDERDPWLSIEFNGELKIPIPFSFLGYHPGRILASPVISFHQTRPVSLLENEASPAFPVYMMRLEVGEMVIDVDDWLEALLPSILQDASVSLVCIFGYKGEWYCMFGGLGLRRGDSIFEFFNFTTNTIVFPIPADMAALGNRLMKSNPLSF